MIRSVTSARFVERHSFGFCRLRLSPSASPEAALQMKSCLTPPTRSRTASARHGFLFPLTGRSTRSDSEGYALRQGWPICTRLLRIGAAIDRSRRRSKLSGTDERSSASTRHVLALSCHCEPALGLTRSWGRRRQDATPACLVRHMARRPRANHRDWLPAGNVRRRWFQLSGPPQWLHEDEILRVRRGTKR